ncbi:hypothetical protein FRC14_004821 [Serendipita sp. 396]|nr:hypothetical protein FRC14_004821 [Serendipita sp. 396]KAG8787565.1 hypothetical protein FRC15_008921 [Serendipita sp. 397]KAG8801281.1 hypothetical protein FRC16_000851 [Serendipita sp. 398]KAG8868877.1 hypothetical protein FRC20_002650 [Serendipita sp. 405]
MFRNLLTPLTSKFVFPNATVEPQEAIQEEEEQSPEDFVRDARIEEMRIVLEDIKTTSIEDGFRIFQVTADIHRIMVEEPRTKDVFRELDGFLVVVGMLSALGPQGEGETAPINSEQQMETIRLAFAIVSEGMRDHPVNTDYFNKQVGYALLKQAITPLITDQRTAAQVVGYLLALCLHNFSVSNLFVDLRASLPSTAKVDSIIGQNEYRLGKVRLPQIILVIMEMVDSLPRDDSLLPYATLKLVERLVSLNHRNHSMLNEVGLVRHVFSKLYARGINMDDIDDAERSVLQRMLRRLLEMGASTAETRTIYQRVVNPDLTIDGEILDILRSAKRAKFPEYFSFDGPASLQLNEDGGRTFPCPLGFTFMTWLYVEKYPTDAATLIFGIKHPNKWMSQLKIRPHGKLQLHISGRRDPGLFDKAPIPRSKWTHVTLVWFVGKGVSPAIRLFFDGNFVDSIDISYPRLENSTSTTYHIGDESSNAQASWSMASAYLFSMPMGNEVPRLFHHLGPRYYSNFQSSPLVRFFTYEAATSLSIYLQSLMDAKRTPSAELSTLLKGASDGPGIQEETILFTLTPSGYQQCGGAGNTDAVVLNSALRKDRARDSARIFGDVAVVKPQCLDVSVWKIGGAAIPLRLVEMSQNSHDLANSLAVLFDGLRTSWQNSEDMERIHGYEILSLALRSKISIIDIYTFNVVFDFLGVDLSRPENATITNPLAYSILALEFEVWAKGPKDVQKAHLEHFTALLETSKFRRFNLKQRMSKFNLVRKLLFVLQSDLYSNEMVPRLVQAIGVYLRHHFVPDVSIKPVVSYLAANLPDDVPGSATPKSIVSRTDTSLRRERAEQVYEVLVQTLANPSLLSKFTLALPLSRVLLLILGEHPSSIVASQTLILLGLVLHSSPSFDRKFELVSGWTALKYILPAAWDPSVHVAAFDLLLGRVFISGKAPMNSPTKVICPYILPTILSSLNYGLERVTAGALLPPVTPTNGVMSHGSVFSHENYSLISAMEVLVEELIDLHSSMASFRQLFKSKHITSILINACQSFVARLYEFPQSRHRCERLLDKVVALVKILAYDTLIESHQKEQLLAIPRLVEYTKLKADNTDTLDIPVVDPAIIPLPSSPKPFSKQVIKAAFQGATGTGSERMLHKSLIRIAEWRKKTTATEKKRRSKLLQDQRELQRQAERHTEWRTLLHSEYGIWPQHTDRYMWRLDDTEGPFRVRKKLELEHAKIPLHVRVQESDSREVHQPEDEAQSVVQLEVPPWEESYEFAATEVEEEQQWDEDVSDDKHRRVRHELEPGDVIQDVRNVTHVTGVDASPGLLILGKTHLYMLDGLLLQEDGEIIEAQDAPKDILLVPGTIVELDGQQPAQRWSLERIATFSKRTFLFRDVALEIYMKDSRSIFVVFPTHRDRQEINNKFSHLMSIRAASDAVTSPAAPLIRSPFLSRVTARVFTGARDEVASARSRWQAREISNFAYLSILNQASGRTRCDVTQYPVFPWVVQDYTSDELDLSKHETFRDLSKPMGALTPARQEAAATRYSNLESIGEPPFHYGTHFSSSMIVCHFLIRMSPFTHMFKTLQGGDWDLPDRLFTDIKRAWDSASKESRGDVRELIPEFFTLPEFLWNSAGLDFGKQTSSGEKINDVKLPPWAKNDPFLFITLHRQALESDYVSRNLPAWIDLIWGYKQKDPNSFNAYHPLSYEGAIDLDAIADPLEREATVGIIHNFGQTPRKLFSHPHPPRIMDGRTSLPLGTQFGISEDYSMLSQDSKPLRNSLEEAVTYLAFDTMSEKVLPCTSQMLYVPLYPHESIHWGLPDQSIRLHIDKKVVQVAESAQCVCAAFADSEALITGMEDSTVGVWKLVRLPGERTSLTWTHILRGHTDRVVNVAASRAWSLIASGSDDQTVILWDLNRAHYVRTLKHDTKVSLVAIQESSGLVASCSKTCLALHTINGLQIAALNLFSLDPIHSIAFHEREWAKTGVLATGSHGTITFRTWSIEDTPPGETAQWKWKTLHEYKCRKVDSGDSPIVTAIKFIGESMYSGDSTGKVYAWDFPE